MRNRILSGALAMVSVAAISFGTVSTAAAAPSYNPYPHQLHGMVASNAKVTDGYFTSASSTHPKIYYKYNTVAKPKAAIVVVHGLAEHSGRYDYLTYRLNLAGFSVYRMDHRGHGKSAEPYTKTQKGNVNSFDYLIDDIHHVLMTAKAQNKGKKVFVLGHSMGAFATQMLETKYPNDMDGTITNGGGIGWNPYGKNTLQPKVITPKGLPAANTKLDPTISEKLPLSSILGFKGVLPSVLTEEQTRKAGSASPDALAKIEIPNSLASGVCSDPKVTEDYQKDPLNAKSFSASTAVQMIDGIIYATYNAKAYTRPTLIMHGQKDGLVPSALSVNWANAIGSKDKEFVFWAGLMHETMNEVVRDQVIDYVINWVNRHL
ncbi:alpha/beta hydrolase [Lawsonella clevelandensis]|uniref:alpha/beta hydrolase n=1 Tax=Lawsonella clevelandensis TaxID=1528099 RepID=UPI0023F3B93B|nr:alpha/beta hydrolase [Lawsonella clevelandensis]